VELGFWPCRGGEVERRRCDRSSSLELEFLRGEGER
jgi:hypothetical protein